NKVVVMPRPAANSYIVLFVLLSLPFTPLTATFHAASQSPSGSTAPHAGIGGIWVLNRNLGDAPAPGTSEDGSNEGRRQGRRGGGRGGGGVAGGIGRGGFGGYGGGQQSEAAREDDMARRQAMMNYIRTFSDAPKQLTVVVHENAVSMTDDDG